jgi:hypothetical protein
MSRVQSPDRRPAVSGILTAIVLAGCVFPPATFAQNNSAPTIGGTPPTTVTIGSTYSFRPSASDPDGDSLRFRIQNRPAWATFSRRTGRLQGAPTVAGTYSGISISVTDGSLTTALPTFQIVVAAPASTPPPPAPVAPPTISGTPPTSARVGQVYAFTPSATDPAGLPLTFAIANKPSWAAFSTGTGTLTGTPGAVDVATFSNITISASNGSVTSSLAPYSITVQQASMGSVTLQWQPPTTRTDGSPLTNLAGYRVYYGTTQGSYPNRITVNSPGLSSFVVQNLPPGTYWFVITAVDSAGLESAQSNSASKQVT